MRSSEPRRVSPRDEPMFNAPAVVVVLAALLVVGFAAFNWARPLMQDLILRDFAFIPGRLTVSLWPSRAIDLLMRASRDAGALEQAQAMRDLRVLGGGMKPWTLLTYAFLHGSWTHVLLNTVWLFAFGPPVARRFGTPGFLMFMGVTAVAASVAQWAATPMEFAPLIGASGAVSGLMGAVTRFMFQPGAPLGSGGFARRTEIEAVRAASLGQTLTERRTLAFIGLWMVTNFVFGAYSQTLGLSPMPVAWVAHVGGFVAGLILFPLFDRANRTGEGFVTP
jgi:membrane associated rhomboid family serine protease